MYKKLFLGVVLAIVVVAVLVMNLGSAEVRKVGPDKFESLIKNKDVFVLQVHTPYYAEIEGTDLVREDWDKVEDYISLLPEDKNKPIAVYCRSGRMSGIVAKTLVEKGYKNVYDLQGGMNAWEASGKILIYKGGENEMR